jgi:S1-C subfamily serine protease
MKRSAYRRVGLVVVLLNLAACALGLAGPAQADEQAAAARAISEKVGDAVVTVRVAVKFRMSFEGEEGEEEENTNETRATVIDPSGLAVCSLAEVDPSHLLKMMREEDPSYKIETQITGMKLVLAQGKEIPAKVVLRDQDLDLAFIRPEQPQTEPLVAVDLAQAAEPQLMDELVIVGRLGEAANRTVSTALDRITAVVKKPRRLYIAGVNTWIAGMGCPAFALDGKVIGITVMRAIPRASGSSDSSNSMPVLLPAADILKVSKQASG